MVSFQRAPTHAAPNKQCQTGKGPVWGLFCARRRGWDMFGSSMCLTPRGCALRASYSAVRIRSGRICRPQWVRPHTRTIRYKKSPMRGSFCSARNGWDMFGSSLSLTLRAARYGPAIRLSKFVPDEFVEPGGFVHAPTPSDTEKAPFGAFSVSGGEGVRFQNNR